MASEEMGGTALEDSSDMGMMCSLELSGQRFALLALASLILILAHYAKIVFGVLEVFLRHDPVPGQSFGAGQGRIAFIASLEILNVHRLWAAKDGRLIWGRPYAVFKDFFLNTVDPLPWVHRAKYLKRVDRLLNQPLQFTLDPMLQEFI
jgi:hypothetical protein